MASKQKTSTKMFVNGVLILTISNLIVKAIGLLFKIPLHDILGDDGMGYFNAAYTIYTTFFMVSTAGLPVAISYMVSRSRAAGNFNQVKKIMRIAFAVFFIIGTVGTCALFFGAGFFSENVAKIPESKYCIMAIAPTLFFVCLTSAFRGYFQGHQVMWPTAVSQLLESLGKLLIGILLANWSIARGDELHITAAWTIFGLTIGVLCGMGFIWITKLLYNTQKINEEYALPNSDTMATESAKSLLKELVVIAIPVTLSSSVMSLANLIDLTVISRQLQSIGFTSKGAAALYGNYTTLAVPMFNLIPVLVYPIGYSLVPMISALLVKKEDKQADKVMTSSLKTAAILSMPCTVGMAVLATPILTMIYGSGNLLAKYTAESSELLNDKMFMSYITSDTTSASLAGPLLTKLAISSFLVCMLAITNSILQANKRPYLPLISMLVGAAAKIAASFLLIGNPEIGIDGAPISTDICYIIVVVCNFYFCAKYANFRPSIRRVFLKPLISAAFCGAGAIGSYTLLTGIIGESRLNTIAAIAVAAVVYFAAIVLLRALDRDDFEFIPMGGKLLKVMDKLHLIK
ncbi:MAG: polysaccharide biosynthesis protein [Ruminococcaceae bacterium]|nr:polysaccharide biosynthesis protein [Oscillospiraceae bacterium]